MLRHHGAIVQGKRMKTMKIVRLSHRFHDFTIYESRYLS